MTRVSRLAPTNPLVFLGSRSSRGARSVPVAQAQQSWVRVVRRFQAAPGCRFLVSASGPVCCVPRQSWVTGHGRPMTTDLHQVGRSTYRAGPRPTIDSTSSSGSMIRTSTAGLVLDFSTGRVRCSPNGRATTGGPEDAADRCQIHRCHAERNPSGIPWSQGVSSVK